MIKKIEPTTSYNVRIKFGLPLLLLILVMRVPIATTLPMARERIVSSDSQGEEEIRFHSTLRPQRFAEYVGQDPLIRKLRIAVTAARNRK